MASQMTTVNDNAFSLEDIIIIIIYVICVKRKVPCRKALVASGFGAVIPTTTRSCSSCCLGARSSRHSVAEQTDLPSSGVPDGESRI